jgi:hypothetical protein
MKKSMISSSTLREIQHSVITKAQVRNRELGKDFYSENPEEYELVDINEYADHKLILLRCPKSKSTVSIKIKKGKML